METAKLDADARVNSTSTATIGSTTPTTDPKPDLIIVFTPPAPASNGSKAAETQKVLEEYENLLKVLKAADLLVQGRSGGPSGDVLVFVKAPEDRVRREMKRERMSDWLHGVSGATSSPRTPRDFTAEPIHSSERVRLVHAMLAKLLPPSQFPHLTSIFPPHDLAFNHTWLTNWSSPSHIWSIPPSELADLKNVYGETVALYFAFLRAYFVSLAFPAGVGALFWLAGFAYSPIYAVGVVAWSVIFVESWRIKEKEIAVEWGTYRIDQVESERTEFVGSHHITDPVTGEEKDVFAWWRITLRQLAALPVLLVFAAFLAGLISVIYAIETIVGEVYDGPGKRYLTLIPTVLFAGVVPQIIALWSATATKLTDWENHPHQTEHDYSLTLKVFSLNFFVAYGSLLLTSYVYIPFGPHLIPYILSILPSHDLKPKTTSFAVNTAKLHTQIVAYTLTNQIVGAFTEVGLPMIMRLVKGEVAKKMGNGAGKVEDSEDEKAFLERMRSEKELPDTVFADYAEMTLQFGYLTLFSLIWPIAPVWSFVNNFFELRSDAFKITSQCRRPVPRREATIGPWLEVLGFITWFGAITNASLVYLYKPHATQSATLDTLSSLAGKNATTPTSPFQSSNLKMASQLSTPTDPGALNAIKSTLFWALLVALATEHGYLLARAGVRYVLVRLSWEGSWADNWVKRGEWEVKKGYLKELEDNGDADAEVAVGKHGVEVTGEVEKRDVKEEEVYGFWSREDKGVEEIKRRSKVE
ncbi:Calcium-activated chloride channel family protein [Pseudohyphozyma bogoriensis]|nr:Calcium-activated chloride channel family protein [Pseudohyphozyma bogoriensis]